MPRCNAKYLWKRIPPDIKNATPELGHIWAVGQNMWKRDYAGIYKALNAVTWSDTVADIMKEVQGLFVFVIVRTIAAFMLLLQKKFVIELLN